LQSKQVRGHGYKYRFNIDFNTTSKTECSYTEKKKVDDSELTGTTVTISGILESVSDLDDRDKMVKEIVSAFAPYLLAYNDIEICYDAYKINPGDYFQDSTETQIEFEKDGNKRDATVKLIQWKSAQGKNLYVYGKSGAAYDTLTIISKNHPISVYVLSDLFDEMQIENTLAMGKANPFYESFITQAQIILKNYINDSFYSDAVQEVKKY
jgi:hypothetical protein